MEAMTQKFSNTYPTTYEVYILLTCDIHALIHAICSFNIFAHMHMKALQG